MFEKKKDKNTHYIHYKKELTETKDLVKNLLSRIEKLEAKDEANSELRKVANMKTDKLREDIGELHELFREIEEQRQEFDVKISQTNNLVSKINPKKILNDSEKQNAKNEMLQGKLDLLNKKFSKFKTRFSSFESKLKVFKGHTELLKIEENAKKQFKEIQKISNTTNSHATKLENHYIKINKTVNNAKSVAEDIDNLRKDILSMNIEQKVSQVEDALKKLKQVQDSLGEENDYGQEIDELAELVSESFNQLKSKQEALHKELDSYHMTKLSNWVTTLVIFMQKDKKFKQFVSQNQKKR